MDNDPCEVAGQLLRSQDSPPPNCRQQFRQRKENCRVMTPPALLDIANQSCPLSVDPTQSCARTLLLRSPTNRRRPNPRCRLTQKGVFRRVRMQFLERL